MTAPTEKDEGAAVDGTGGHKVRPYREGWGAEEFGIRNSAFGI